VAAALGGCAGPEPAGDDTGPVSTVDSGTDSTPTEVDACAEGGFDPVARTWGLPDGGASGTWTGPGASAGDCSVNRPAWFATDLDADGRLDLVHTTDCGDAEVGTSRWQVVLGDSLGFTTAAVSWALPAGRAAGAFSNPLGADRDCTTGVPAWSHHQDLTGDGRPDLVVTADCDDPAVGTDHWLVYPNTGLGYATTATTWRLPAEFGERAFEAPLDTPDCERDAPAWRLMDLDGDLRPDLVATAACGEADVGGERWLVWFSGGTGFSPVPVDWPLPSLGEGALAGPASAPVCDGATRPSWLLGDMDGDGQADLTVTGSCDDPELGHEAWRVYRGNGSGFEATGGRWPLPAGHPPASFYAPREVVDCDAGLPAWALFDLDGDAAPDVVLTASCQDATVGSSRWLFHPSRGARFDGVPIGWTLPTDFPVGSFERTHGESSCTSADRPAWFLADPDGTGVVDLLITEDCDDADVGTSRWTRYLGSCG